MYTCRICKFEVTIDDVVVRSGDNYCVCLSCYGRVTESSRPMPKALRKTYEAVLAGI